MEIRLSASVISQDNGEVDGGVGGGVRCDNVVSYRVMWFVGIKDTIEFTIEFTTVFTTVFTIELYGKLHYFQCSFLKKSH